MREVSVTRLDQAATREVPTAWWRRPWVPTLAATGLATLTSLLFLGRKPFWLDEGYSFAAAHRSLSDLARLLTHDENNMGLYYIALHFWLNVGRSEAVVRLLSVFAAVATVPLLCALARRLYDSRTAMVVGLFAAADAMLVQYAQEARAYSLLVLTTTASTLLFVRLMDRPGARAAVGWVVVSASAVYVHYFAVLVIVAQLASMSVLRPPTQTRRVVVRSALAWVLLAVPLVGFAAGRGTSQLASAQSFSVIAPARLWARIFGSIPLALVAAALIVYTGVRVVHQLRPVPRGQQAWRETLPWLLLVVPPLLTLALSLVQPTWRDRYLIIVAPPALLLLARAVTLMAARPQRLIALGVILALMVAGLASYYRPTTKQGTDWRNATAAIAQQQRVGDAVWFLPGTGYVPALYYAWKRSRPLPPDLGLGVPGLRGRVHPATAPTSVVATRAQAYTRVWVVLLEPTVSSARAGVARQLRRVARVLGRHWRLLSAAEFGPLLQLRLYARTS